VIAGGYAYAYVIAGGCVISHCWLLGKGRTPDNTLRTQIQKVKNFQNFIWTVSGNFYLDGGSGTRHEQNLSGHGSGLPKTVISTFFALKHQFFTWWLLWSIIMYTSYKHFVD